MAKSLRKNEEEKESFLRELHDVKSMFTVGDYLVCLTHRKDLNVSVQSSTNHFF